MDFVWKCPVCTKENIDDYTETAVPMCSRCGYEAMWEELMSKETQSQYNKPLHK